MLELIQKKFLSVEELNRVLEDDYIVDWCNCGNSGLYIGYIWYTVTTKDGEEYSIYGK